MAIHPTNRKTIGTCSECGGPVQTPEIWGAITPPPVECADCGARPKQSHGPVIEMERPSKREIMRKNWCGADPDLLGRLFGESFIQPILDEIDAWPAWKKRAADRVFPTSSRGSGRKGRG